MKKNRQRVVYIDKEHLKKYNIIDQVFYYEDLELSVESREAYENFENQFIESYSISADVYNINEFSFYMKDSNRCNAFAIQKRGYNIIGITNVYPILLSKKLNSKYFEKFIFMGLMNKENIGLAYIDLINKEKFNLSKFMLDSSINFTFGHEFRHILQFNSTKIRKESYYLQENLIDTAFDIRKHTWEFDADRSGCYAVLKFVFRTDTELNERSPEKFKCLLYAGCASMIITKCLFYFGVMHKEEHNMTVKKIDFYTKKYSHPHPLVRCANILDYYFSNIKDDFPNLDIEYQEFFNNVFGILEIYFDSLLGNNNILNEIFNDFKKYNGEVTAYNNELYDLAIQDEAIRNLLVSSNTSFED